MSLLLLNSHFSTAGLRPFLPNVIEIGGIHLKSSPLPTTIQNFLDSAEHGAVFFSLGSKVNAEVFSNGTFEKILSVFSRLQQKVIMKSGTENLRNVPGNVFIGKWLPQIDILAHPNVKLFISHCGVNSIVEAKKHAVPILAVPLYSDQFGNAKKVQNEGWGKIVDLKKMSEMELLNAIEDVLNNPR